MMASIKSKSAAYIVLVARQLALANVHFAVSSNQTGCELYCENQATLDRAVEAVEKLSK